MIHLLFLIAIVGSVLSAPAAGLTVTLRTSDGDSVFYADLADTVTVDVSVDSEGESLTGLELFVSYDPTLFLPIDTDFETPGNQPAVSANVFDQVFADSVIVATLTASVIHYAEVDLVGTPVSGQVVSFRFLAIGRRQGSSDIRILQDILAGFSSLYTGTDRDGESTPIPADARVTFRDDPPAWSGATAFTIEEDGGPGFAIADLVTDEGPATAVSLTGAFSDDLTTVAVDGDSLRFTTPDHFHGEVTGTVTVSDPSGGEDTADISLTVTPVNDKPQIDATSLADTIVVGIEPVVLTLAGSDVDNDPADLAWFTIVTGDSLTADLSGTTLTLTAADGWNGPATLTVQLADPGGLVDFRTVTVFGNAKKGDFDRNGLVDFTDFLAFAEAFGNPDADPKFDLDGSGAVDFGDFLILIENFG